MNYQHGGKIKAQFCKNLENKVQRGVPKNFQKQKAGYTQRNKTISLVLSVATLIEEKKKYLRALKEMVFN